MFPEAGSTYWRWCGYGHPENRTDSLAQRSPAPPYRARRLSGALSM